MSLTRMLGKAADARWSIVLTCLCFVFATGCFLGGGGNNGNNGGNNGNNGGSDAGADTTDDDGGTTEDGGDDDGGTTEDGGDDDGGTGTCTAATPSGDCDPLCRTGCEEGQTCQAGPTADGYVAQCQPSGAAGQGESCGESAACQEGFGCITGIDPDSAICVEYCRVGSSEDPQCSAAGAECRGFIDENSNIGICVVSEDACTILGGECDSGQSCAWTSTGNQCFANDDTAAQGDECSTAADCPADYVCIQVTGDSTPVCRAHCTESDQSNCPESTACGGVDTTGDGNAAFFACFAQ